MQKILSPFCLGLKFVAVYFVDPFDMNNQVKRLETVLDLSAMLVQKNRDFTMALKEKKPHVELKALHSEIQEIYNHLASLKSQTA